MSADVKGDAYEGLLERNAQDTKGGAGQYFTPRAAHRRHRRLRPARSPARSSADPACGTGRLPPRRPRLPRSTTRSSTSDQKKHLRYEALRGVELVDSVAAPLRDEPLPPRHRPRRRRRARTADQDRRLPAQRAVATTSTWSLTNPPFGKKSQITVVNEEGETDRETLTYNRPDFWTTTSNKQLNFVQHVKSLLKIHGRAAVVVPDNVLFEGGAGETVRRKLLHECEVHTLLRLPTGIFYAQGVKANVLFFDRKPASEEALDEGGLGLRPPHQQALHAQDRTA